MSDVLADSKEIGSTPSRARGWELVKTRDFGFLFAGQTISQVGDSLNKVALLWFVYEMTGSALKMTVVGLLQTLPPLLLGPLIGVYLDRVRKKPVMIGVDLLRTLMVLLIPLFYAMGALTLDRLYFLVFATAIFSTVFGPALTSAVPLIVPKERLIAANALLQTTTNVGLLVGPAVSGLGIALIGAQNVLYADAATFFISALCLFPIRMHETLDHWRTVSKGRGLAEGITSDVLAGFRFVFVEQKTVLLLMLTATLYSVGISAFIFLLPVFAKEVLGVGPIQLGWLWSALGVGMLLASLSLTSITQGDVSWRLRFMSGALAIGGLAVAALGFLEAPVVAAALIAVIGGSTAMFTPLVWTMLQELTPAHLLGRVFTSFATGGMASSMAGMAGFGWAADTIGPAASLGGISLILLMTAATAWLFSFYKSHTGSLVVSTPGSFAS
ncbi:MAG: MFS transporter [Nitrospira sp. LK70]|nr:MFS transporter [Nitrospira sp. LK70]